ncbi:Gfo/Idh/MocA family protein [Echinicola shivajiensis]|uniref:Gfo/Idh/MocA family protein n=1 Tax=Echinicola shivajiensis TaxID=1035916 RepID=UPI001BFC6BAE|nr:Gfo/Idh/MocA family oxidoreductase [Echinicola shivajiensis]
MNEKNSRRDFLKKSALTTAGIGLSAMSFPASSYSKILGANDRIQVGIVGFSSRAKSALIPAFLGQAKELNFEFTAVSDIWNRRRDEAVGYIKGLTGTTIAAARNNDELYDRKDVDAVIISTADFQHALHCKEAVEAGRDVYVEKPFAETMADARAAKEAALRTGKVIQIGSQRRSGANYHAANKFIKGGNFGDIVAVEMTWNVNQPGRWRRTEMAKQIRKEDTDWKRYLMNRPYQEWDPRKYLEFRLFWPFSSGIPGQWMAHQIDTVHWFTDLPHPRSVAANGGIYMWKDGRENFDTMTAVMDYGPLDDKSKGFQVIYSSRFTNSAGGTKEIYYSNAGELNLDTNMISPNGGLREKYAKDMGMKENLLHEKSLGELAKVETSANTGVDDLTSAHMRNWMECVRSRKKPNADVMAGYNHSIANIMTTAALRTGQYVTFDEEKQEVLAGGKVFQY